jgi:hypothetical protein
MEQRSRGRAPQGLVDDYGGGFLSDRRTLGSVLPYLYHVRLTLLAEATRRRPRGSTARGRPPWAAFIFQGEACLSAGLPGAMCGGLRGLRERPRELTLAAERR